MGNVELAEYFAEMARKLMEARTVKGTMDVITAAAVEIVDPCDHASLSYIRGRALISAASNDDVGVMLDGIQTGAEEGPCLDAIRLNSVTVAADLRTDAQWPIYGPRAFEATGVLSSAGYPLRDGGTVIGALNLFADEANAFDESEPDLEATIAILAAHAIPALAAALFREEMSEALARRDVIGQAKGLLMAQSNVDEDKAFEMLVRASQRMNVKLAEVARRLVKGELSEEPG
jgi:GAF domain-containing protein